MDLIDGEVNKKRFEDIYNKSVQESFRICYSILKNHYDAEDAVMDAFSRVAKLFNRIGRFSERKIINYIKLASKHSALNLYKSRKKKRQQESCNNMKAIPSFEERLVEKEANRQLYNTIVEQLPDIYFDTLYMKYVLELTPNEIADTLNVNIYTVYKRLERAKQMVKDMLGDDENG